MEGRHLNLSYDGHDLSDLEIYANDAAGLLCLWNTKPRLPWQTKEYYRVEAATLQPDEFRRVHQNEWISSTSSFVPIEWWDACRGPLPDLDRFREIVVALDAAVSDDCFAIVAMSRHDGKSVVRYSRKWQPPQGGKIEFRNHDDPADTEYPEGELRRLAQEYNVICFAYDPHQLESFASDMRALGLGMFESFGQGAPRLIADKSWYDAIRERQVIHSGESDLRQHIMNSNSTAEEKDTLRIVKRADTLKIDLNVAASMCHATALKYLPD
jgi:phage terminase large subunit-like protein